MRERISEGVLREGYVFKYDISIPISSYYKVIEVITERLRDPRVIRISGYGHLGMIKYLLNVSIFLNLNLNNLEINSNSRRLQFKLFHFFFFLSIRRWKYSRTGFNTVIRT